MIGPPCYGMALSLGVATEAWPIVRMRVFPYTGEISHLGPICHFRLAHNADSGGTSAHDVDLALQERVYTPGSSSGRWRPHSSRLRWPWGRRRQPSPILSDACGH